MLSFFDRLRLKEQMIKVCSQMVDEWNEHVHGKKDTADLRKKLKRMKRSPVAQR